MPRSKKYVQLITDVSVSVRSINLGTIQNKNNNTTNNRAILL